MPQVLKDDVRARILVAAVAEFAARGFDGTTMAAIGARAGLGAASLYRYYPGKEQLFDAVVPPALADAFEALLDRRVRALGAALTGGEGDTGGEMLRFWCDHRLAVVILLDRAAGTPYARFGERFVDALVSLTIEQIRAAHPGARVSAPTRFVLRRIFENTRGMIASILEQHDSEPAIRDAIESFWSYQIAGLHGLTRHIAGEAPQPPAQ